MDESFHYLHNIYRKIILFFEFSSYLIFAVLRKTFINILFQIPFPPQSFWPRVRSRKNDGLLLDQEGKS